MSQDSENEFKFMLESLNTIRRSIFSCMVFSIKNSEYSCRILDMICDICKNKIAGLYVISDILYNCNKVDIQCSWSYLPLIETRLPLFLKGFKGSCEAINVINAWEKWGILDKKYLLGLKSIVDEKEYEENDIISTYKEIIMYCDEYFIKNKCKELGQSIEGTKEEQVARILHLINYVIVTNGIKSHWLYVEIDENGTMPEKIIEMVDKKIDLLISPQINGEALSDLDMQIIRKLIGLFPNTYIIQHQ